MGLRVQALDLGFGARGLRALEVLRIVRVIPRRHVGCTKCTKRFLLVALRDLFVPTGPAN